ncbi:corticoliberin-like [Eudromia elegans]
MRARMISAASVLVLLFLPSETCSPLQWPRGPRGGRRREGRPNSLDLTFHLLREFLDMSREERLARKALTNKLLLQSIGK